MNTNHPPTESSYAALLRNCNDLHKGKKIHVSIACNNLGSSTFLNNLLVQMYGRCGSPELARQVFENLETKNTYSWTLMTLAYTQNGYMRDAVKLYKQVFSQRTLHPDIYTFSGILRALVDPRDLEEGKEIHKCIIISGCQTDVVVATGLVGMYSRCGSLALARDVFDKMKYRDHIAWTTMIVAYAHSGHSLQALRLYKEMQDSGVYPSVFTYAGVLGACSELRDLQQGRDIHRKVSSEGLESPVVQNALVDMYAKCGSLDEAREVFEKISRKDSFSWSTIISAYARHEKCALKAVDLFMKMDLEGVMPDGYIFSSVITALTNLGDLDHGRRVHSRLIACGEGVDVVTAAALVKLYAKCGCLEDARCLFDSALTKDLVLWANMIVAYANAGNKQEAMALYNKMLSQGIEPDAHIYTCMLDVCCSLMEGEELLSRISRRGGFEHDPMLQVAKLGLYLRFSKLEEARKTFDASSILKHSQVAASMIIAEFVKAGQPEEALAVYRGMEIRPDVVTYGCIVGACAALGAVSEGMLVHDHIVKDGLNNKDFILQNAILNMYTKCGKLKEAEHIFEDMFQRNAVSWTAMITAYAQNGFVMNALQLFNEMNLEYSAPDHLTFTMVLHACSHLGLVSRGHECFVSMKNDYGIEPLMEHYIGMADVLTRAGRLQEAQELVQSMPYQATDVAFTTVLSVPG